MIKKVYKQQIEKKNFTVINNNSYALSLQKLTGKKIPEEIFKDKELTKKIIKLMHVEAGKGYLHTSLQSLHDLGFYYEDIYALLSLEISSSGNSISQEKDNPLQKAAKNNSLIQSLKTLYYTPSRMDFVTSNIKFINTFCLLKVTGGEKNPKSTLHIAVENRQFPKLINLFLKLYPKANLPIEKIKIFFDVSEFFTNKTYPSINTPSEIILAKIIKNRDVNSLFYILKDFSKKTDSSNLKYIQEIAKPIFDLYIDKDKKQKGIHLIAQTGQLRGDFLERILKSNIMSISAICALFQCKDTLGNTPLHLAHESLNFIKNVLLKYGLSNKEWNKIKSIKNNDGQTPQFLFSDYIKKTENQDEKLILYV